ncbi:MAG: UDP-glucuronic acid decarboxylase family protein [Planctomycetota bacterium]
MATTIKRILITGGAGFLGSHLCERMVDAGHDVICLDNLFTSQKSNIGPLLDRPNFEFIRHDITEPITLEVDQVYNMACPASPVHYQYNPIKTMKVSVMGAINLLGMAKRTDARILQASTSEIYGDPTPEHHPQKETYRGNVNPIGVRACYDEGKRAAETLFFDYHRSNGVDIRVVRIFNTYGPRMHPYDGRVVTNFIVQALQGEDLTVYGDGSQTRSFCYVDDLVDAIVATMNNHDPAACPNAAPTDPNFIGPVNIGNPDEFTIRQLAEKVIELTGAGSKIVELPLPSDDPLQRKPDISVAKEKLGWEPKVKLEQGLAKAIDYFRSVDLSRFRKPTDHTAHANTDRWAKG